MKEKPILFNGEMVRAVMEGRKTQTRRVMRPQPGCGVKDFYHRPDGSFQPVHLPVPHGVACGIRVKSPYGLAGGQLWVRETWSNYWMQEDTHDSRLQCIHYRASWDGSLADDPPWKPSIHMPRTHSRINLLIKRVWVERVWDITLEDIKAEGVPVLPGEDLSRTARWIIAVGRWETLWDSINGEPRNDGADISWKANPWVWCVEFERIES